MSDDNINFSELPDFSNITNESELKDIVKKIDQSDPKQIAFILSKLKSTLSITKSNLPDPEIIKGYEEIKVGLGTQLLDQFIKQSNHRIEMDKLITESEQKRINKGQWIAAILIIILIYSAYSLSSISIWLSGAIFITTILGIGTIFYLGKSVKIPTTKNSNQK